MAFAQHGDQWFQMSSEPVETTSIRVHQNGYAMLIELEEPHKVHLGPTWSTGFQRTRERIVPLHIDILETGSVRYTISGPYAHELRKI